MAEQKQEDLKQEKAEYDILDVTATILENHFKGYAKVDVDRNNKAVRLIPEGDFEMATMALLLKGKDAAKLSDLWDQLTIPMSSISESLSKVEPGYIITIESPLDDGKQLLIAKNGTIIYNIMDDLD